SIEIIKGPGSALFGRSEPGGTINIITKKPQFYEEGYIQATASSYDLYRLEGEHPLYFLLNATGQVMASLDL
ncbi:MAG: hypothetical protein VYD53_12285, partial [Pseudomonadota bacterium]|nr:hypothetical protein [Pseudomonadota bacterium]